MEQHINITLLSGDTKMDMRIPCTLEIRKLIRELDQILGKTDARKKYELRIKNKGLILDEGKVLSNYPVTTGDILEIVEV
ncbi:EsaB/YukD family protein [Streptococcus intermedius]|jgi:yukD|uniref:EsaB/YukD family protein n=1 Tax=Streptococcus intermedius TaxID=1338 RepID=UPI000C82C593|nr:EsaB/YukD family protein [Streptococcus intermedius]PMR63815.1 secretion accessory protein EsaB/YukD [Streptococcus intermedius]RSJ13696.1 YukD [Streptococcus intermedius]RSJ26719.1 YukD [Streptococcus intermedius]WOI90483.1 EsaB/YukD family protein [Streptococcus intermedius]